MKHPGRPNHKYGYAFMYYNSHSCHILLRLEFLERFRKFLHTKRDIVESWRTDRIRTIKL